MNPTKCPHCGAESVNSTPLFTIFECGSTEWRKGIGISPGLDRERGCYDRQIDALQSEFDKRKWQPIETATIEEVARFKACIREILQVVKVHAAKAESDPTGEHLGCSELDWSGCVDHLAMAANSLTEPPKEDLPPLPVEAVKANSQHPPKLKKSINEPQKDEQ